ncbi:hypothetical protein LPJ59_000631 [Coemansia sp. RSA 2399]|nr:hypothetical protein LPJ59_000631 [Coemansia sp. RSA 2399]
MKSEIVLTLFSVVVVSVAAAPAAPASLNTLSTRSYLEENENTKDLGNERFQWPWSQDKGQLDIQIPSSSLSFEPDVTITSLRCLQATLTLKSRFNTDCFQGSKSLYFSSPGQVCSPKCLNETVELSKYLVDKCNLASKYTPGDPAGYKHKNIVYLSWADQDMARLVCNGPTVVDDNDKNAKAWKQNAGCYSAIFAAETARESNLLANGGSAEEYACNSCTKEWVKRIGNSTHHLSPILYYGHIPDSARLASWISEQCGYIMPPIK